MFTSYLDCEIEIFPRHGDAFPFSVRAPGGDARGYLRLPTADLAYRALAEKLLALETDEELLSRIGQHLFNALFHDQAKEVLARSQALLTAEQGLRIKLNIAPSEFDVAILPWEYLCDPDQGPLALLDMPIVRYLPQPHRIPVLATTLPLKVLLTGAAAEAAGDVERELREVEAALAELGTYVQIVVEPRLTTARLQQLLRGGFHIWHFVGRGGFGKDGRTGHLYFESPTGGVEAVSALQLGILLNRSGVRLVLLDACDSAKLTVEPFRCLAPALIRAQVSAVVAMQFTAPEQATRAFAVEFYRTLAEGFPIDACLTEGRKAVMNVSGLGRADWGVPVVYTRAPDGQLFDAQPPAPEARVAGPPANLPQPNRGGPADGRLTMQRALAERPELYSTFIDCRNTFLATSKRISVLNEFKELHDQFQRLENCYSTIYHAVKRLPLDQSAWEYLGGDVREFQQIADMLLDCAGAVGEGEALWTEKLDRSRRDLEAAYKQRDVSRLMWSLQVIDGMLGREPSRINTRLVAAAGELHLSVLLRALRLVQGRLTELSEQAQVALPQLDMFEHGVNTLAQFADRLDLLIDNHNIFQEIDDELRWVEACIDHDVREVQKAWQSLQPKMQKLCARSRDKWAARLEDICAEMERTLAAAAEDTALVKEIFLEYRSQVNRSFNKIDWDLRAFCRTLGDGGRELAPILGMVA